MTKSSNVVWHNATVTRDRREKLNKHKGAVFWFTGLSGSGKSSLAHAVEEELFQKGIRTVVLDGDNVRHGFCGDLAFSDEDRKENIRRISHISPFSVDRENARKIIGADFNEIYCECSIDVCEQRDVKGLYKRARAGEIPDFTGISSPYEKPVNPELAINTERDFNQSVEIVTDFFLSRLDFKG